MRSERRIGAEDSATRDALLDAALRLLVEEGYASVTSRKVAGRADLKPQLVHYYFRTMDDLFLALVRRGAAQNLERQARALESDQPLRALWELATDPAGTIFTTELFAGEMPPPDWWYYAREEGQHISFYNRSALEALAERLGMRLLSNGWLHMLTAKPIRSWAFAMALSRPSRRLSRLLGRRRPSLVQHDHAAMVARRRAADGAG